jgi:serine protease Do
MIPTRRFWRRTSVAVGLVALAAVVGVVASRSHGAPAPTLWTDRPVVAAPAAGPPSPWIELARRLKPAVVNVNTTRTEPVNTEPGPGRETDPFDQFFRQFFGPQPPHTVRSLGSGFIINPSGYVVTNNHVVDDATEIRVKLSDGRVFPAQVVGRDATTDVALLKIPASGLPVIPLGDSSNLQVGEPVMAIGNPFGLEQTVTTGIISATGRVIGAGPYDDFIQTDASVNPGNSGGPLINVRGQAIGINTAIFTADGGSNGIGFAIPISLAKSVITQLAAGGRVVRGWLGVTTQALTPALARALRAPDSNGALVGSVVPDSPAMKAGLRPGDIIVEYGGRPVDRPEGLSRAVAATPVGRDQSVVVLRDGRRLGLSVTIAELPEQPSRPSVAKAAPEHGALGLAVQSLTPDVARRLGLPDHAGVLVQGVEDDSPAAEAGFQTGDVIVEADHQPVRTVEDLGRVLKAHPPGSPVLFQVHREGDSVFIALG